MADSLPLAILDIPGQWYDLYALISVSPGTKLFISFYDTANLNYIDVCIKDSEPDANETKIIKFDTTDPQATLTANESGCWVRATSFTTLACQLG